MTYEQALIIVSTYKLPLTADKMKEFREALEIVTNHPLRKR